jgi:predicted  nucleic acid-binding Zn-ribbon protein
MGAAWRRIASIPFGVTFCRRLGTKVSGAAIEQGVDNLFANPEPPIDPHRLARSLDDALAGKSLNEMLKVYNRKSLADRISTCFNLKNGEYPELLLRLMKGPDREQYVKALVTLLPAL